MELPLPRGLCLGEAAIAPGDDPHVQGRRAALRALAALLGEATQVSIGYDGTRPIVVGAVATISITHGRTRALAIAARLPRLGIDLVDDADHARLTRLAARFLGAEQPLAHTPHDLAACFAAKEAGLKALGLGLLDGGMFDACAVRVVSLAPPLLDPSSLSLVLGRVDDATVAVAYAPR